MFGFQTKVEIVGKGTLQINQFCFVTENGDSPVIIIGKPRPSEKCYRHPFTYTQLRSEPSDVCGPMFTACDPRASDSSGPDSSMSGSVCGRMCP